MPTRSSDAHRQGKVVNYAISELRSMELLDDLCMNMDDYKLSKTKQGVPTYIKVNNHGGSFTVDGTMTLGGDQSSVDSVKLHSYCDLLLELIVTELRELLLLRRG